MLSLALLGPFAAELDDRPLTQFHTTKAQALLIYAAVESQHVHQREALMELLWPGLPLQSAQQSLRQTLYRLRQVIELEELEAPFILAERFTIGLNSDAPVWLDTAEFERLSGLGRTPQDWRQAADLYRGEFLADFYLSDSETFEAWALGRRAAYQREAQALFGRLAAYYLAQGQYGEAETAVRQNLDLDYFQEAAQRQLMRVLAGGGRRQEALLHFDEMRRRLWDELAIEPEEETAAMAAAIRSGELSFVPAAEPVRAAAASPASEAGAGAEKAAKPLPNNLPNPPTPFIGRRAELSALDALMSREEERLVTIVGPGGMGKTRLALAWAANQIERQNGHVTGGSNGRSNSSTLHPFRHGISFVNLAPLPAADLIIPTLANVLNFPLQKSSDREDRSPKQQILDYLCRKNMLLLFDNFEHLLDGVDVIVDILAAASNVKILVTSRERLNLRQEQVYPIQGLEFPDWETPEDATAYTAVQLFLQSARRNLPDFELTGGDNLTYLARICRLVAGMPLAIELAAAWVEMLTLEEIAAEIQQGLDILETELRDAPPRQRSVRATIDYSWQKLAGPEREIFAKLSVFRGGFTRDAAEEIAGANLRQLSHLQNKSLLQVDREDGRFQLHELLRQYAAEKLNQEDATAEEIRGCHARFYAEFLAAQEPHFYGPQESETLRRLDLERDNIDAAWQWLVNHKETGYLLKAINPLLTYFDIRVRVQDGLARCNELVNWCQIPDGPQEKLLLARALYLRCYLNIFYFYDAGTMEANLNEAAALLDDLSGSGLALNDDFAYYHCLSGLYLQPGVVASDEVREHFESALRYFHQAGNLRGIVMMLNNIAGINFYSFADKGGYKAALELSDQALKIARLIKSGRLMTEVVTETGIIALQAGDFSLLETLMVEVEKALIRLKETGAHFEPERLLERYAWMLSLTGRHEAALATQMEFQSLRRELGIPLHAITEFQFGFMLGHIGRYAEARAYCERSLAMGRQTESVWIIGLNHVVIGMNRMATGELEAAESTLRQGLALQDEIDNGLDRAGNLGNLGLALARLGKYGEAKSYLMEGLEIAASAHGYLPLIETLPGIALTLAHDDPPQRELALKTWAMLQSQAYYANSRLFQDMSGRYLQEFVESLPLEESQAALENGRTQGLWTGTAEILTAVKELGWGGAQRESGGHLS